MITPQNTLAVNAVVLSKMILSTSIVQGALKTSTVLQYRGANLGEDGKFTDLGSTGVVTIPDVAALPTDLAAQQDAVNALRASIISAADAINAVRKVV
jgi:hypothetical protein